MCFGVTSDYNEHTCLCLLRSLCLPPLNVPRDYWSEYFQAWVHLTTSVRIPWCKKKKIDRRRDSVSRTDEKSSHSFKFRLTLYDRIHTHNRTLSELIISIALISRGSASVFRDNRTCELARHYLARLVDLQKEKEQNFVHARDRTNSPRTLSYKLLCWIAIIWEGPLGACHVVIHIATLNESRHVLYHVDLIIIPPYLSLPLL